MKSWIRWLSFIIAFIAGGLVLVRNWQNQVTVWNNHATELSGQNNSLKASIDHARTQLQVTQDELEIWKSTDQTLINQQLNQELASLKDTLKSVISSYDDINDLRSDKKQLATLDKYFAQSLDYIVKENYASATATLRTLQTEIKKEEGKRVAQVAPAMGSVGTQVVKTNSGDFSVRVISADLKTTKVLVDTASDKDCGDNCPVLPLSTYASRSGAFAAINGPYFCPASYPNCASKKNSFDTLMMNKEKYYFNSGNNVYSSVPAAIFSTTSRFVRQSSEWGRDTGVDSVIAGQPLLVFNGESQFGGDGDPKKSGKGTRGFIGATESVVYIGLVYNATVAEMAQVLTTMGIKNAINLDSGGSTAMWQNGKYVAGPGRDLPFGIVLVRR